jgi:short-subunit dehydrogenase
MRRCAGTRPSDLGNTLTTAADTEEDEMTDLNERYGPWALIIGGSEGIGEHLARKLGAAGINIVMVARKAEALAEASRKVREATAVEVRTIELDITREDMLEQIRKVTDGVDIGLLVHNVSGVSNFGSFVEQPLEPALAVVQANVIAVLKLVHHFGKPMADRGRGGILFFGSLAAMAGSYFLATYSAAKAFNQIFSEALWAELQPRGVDVLSFLVGLTDTPSYRRSGATDRTGAPVADPETVAQHALDQLGQGPVGFAPEHTHYVTSLANMSRRQAAETKRSLMSRNHPDKK